MGLRANRASDVQQQRRFGSVLRRLYGANCYDQVIISQEKLINDVIQRLHKTRLFDYNMCNCAQQSWRRVASRGIIRERF